jgi:glutamate synthase (NADPH/NADH) large chain
VRLRGSAGQSLGAFAVQGLTLELFGDANDYVGKGLSGGTIIVRPMTSSRLATNQNTIIGNTVLYGATAGKLFAAGQAGERFAVRNSGADVVIEGCGSNGCEYMTGGVAVILGATGRNLAAGMSGGFGFVLDLDPRLVNPELVDVERVHGEHAELLLPIVRQHAELTGSAVAAGLLADWPAALARFSLVMPRDYRRVLEATRRAQAEGVDVDAAVMAAART